MSDFLTVERIGNTREKTPEGYLLCRDVPISRTGVFDYRPIETGIAGRGGIVKMARTAEELFSPKTIASFEGKPIVIGHGTFPDPSNFSAVAKGHVQNVRRGDGDVLLADLLITTQDAIERVERGDLEEVSCGYNAESVADGVGEGHQVGIVGNHVALVPKARCKGCKIGDESMTDSQPKTWKARLRRLFKDSDEEGFQNALDEINVKDEAEQPAPAPEPDPTQQRLENLEKLVTALSEKVDALSPKADADPEAEAEPEAQQEPPAEKEPEEDIEEDAKADEVFADCETLAPGMKRPVGDSKDGKFSKSCLERTKREAIKAAGITAFGDVDSLDGTGLEMAFKGALALVRERRNPKVKGFGDGGNKPRSNADLNNYFNKFWSK